MISSLYQKLPADSERLLRNAVAEGLANGSGRAQIFFRADDIGVPGKQFSQLIQRFRDNGLPLCLAVVPSWLSQSRFATLLQDTGTKSSQWCWHQHGWLHSNHEHIGKKQEFGSARLPEAQVADLAKGQRRLQSIMCNAFSPFFTPPWNRCSLETLQGLQQLGFHAVSRSKGAKPPPPRGLPDIQVNIDLHTRKETDPGHCLQQLLQEVTQGVASGTGGIMIHHQRMNQDAFDFLALLLHITHTEPGLHPVLFPELC